MRWHACSYQREHQWNLSVQLRHMLDESTTRTSPAEQGQAAGPEFNGPVLPSSVRLLQSTVSEPNTNFIQLLIEYPDMTTYDQRTDLESNNPKWRSLFAEQPDSPHRLVSAELLSEIVPKAPL